MKTEELNNKDLRQASYTSPDVKVIETVAQRVICGSNQKYEWENINPWS